MSADLKLPFTAIIGNLNRALQANNQYSDLINLGIGNPATEVDPKLLDALTNPITDAGGMSGYAAPDGDISTKRIVADFMQQVRKTPYIFDAQCNQIALTGGITETIKDYLQARYNRDKKPLNVLVPTPAYAWYFNLLKQVTDATPIKMDTSETGWKITAESLEYHLIMNPNADAIILNYPCNPTGTNLSPYEWSGIADVIRKHVKDHPHFRIILDNAYKDLAFADQKTGLLEIAPDLMANTIEFNSVAKFHGYAGNGGPGFAVSQNVDDIAMLRSMLAPKLGQGQGKEEMLRRAFSPEYFTPERVEQTLSIYRRRCKFIANYVNENLKLAAGANSQIILPAQGGMFVFADFSRWIGKKIEATEARDFRKTLAEKLPAQADYINNNVFEKNTINDDKDLAFYLFLKAQVAMIPGQDFGTEPKAGMMRLSLGGRMTSYNNSPLIDDLSPYLLDEPNLKSKPLDDLRKLKTGMDRVIGVLKDLEKPRSVA